MKQSAKAPIRRLTTSGLAALILFAGVTVILESASAVTVALTPDATVIAPGAVVTITMRVSFATDDAVPVIYNRLIFEGPNPPAILAREFRWAIDGGIISSGGCASLTVRLVATSLGAIAGYGYFTPGAYLGRSSGYGYEPTVGHGSAGYASSGPGARTDVPDDSNVFAGYAAPAPGVGAYGPVGADNTLVYVVTFNSNCLAGNGKYRVTGELTTDYWGFQSKFETIEIASPGGSSSSTGGGTPAAPGTGTGETQTIAMTATTKPAGALAAYTATIATAATGNTIVLNTGDGTWSQITLVTSGALSNAVVTVVVWPPANPPPGSSALPGDTTISSIMEITITNAEGKIQKATVQVKLPQANVPDAAKGVLLRQVTGQWPIQGKFTFALAGGTYTGTAESACCSVFAVAFDTRAPQVTLAVPGGTVSGVQKLMATATDNLQVTKVEFYVDNQLKSTDTSSPFEYNFDTASVSNGEHTVKAIAYDFVDNKAEDSETMTTQNEGAPGASPAGPAKKGIPAWVWFLIIVLIVALIIGAVVLSGKKPGGGKPGAKK